MRARLNHNSRQTRQNTRRSRMLAATRPVLEPMEKRVMMTTTLSAWDFGTLAPSTSVSTIETSPPPTSGNVASASMAYTVGMSNSSAGGYTYPAIGAAANGDASTFLLASQVKSGSASADTGGNGGSEEGTNGFVWRVESGFAEAAPIASQGIQIDVPTTGFTGIQFSFDMDPSSTNAPAQFIVQYTTNVNAAAPAWTNVTQDLTFGPGDTPDPLNSNYVAVVGNTKTYTPAGSTTPVPTDVWLQNNPAAGGNTNIASGTYATVQGPIVGGSNTAWLNDLQIDLSVNNGFTDADNAPDFAFRVVNAATGTSETTVAGSPVATFKNWRFNDIHVLANSAAAPAAPVVQTNPQSATVNATSVVSFTSSASGYPLASEQWQVSLDGGNTFQNVTGTNVPNATNFFNSSTLTITSATAAESGDEFRAVFNNGIGGDASNNVASGAATLTVNPIFPPTVISNPTSVTTNGTNTVTFTSTASGNPAPTVQWQFEPAGGTSYTNVSSGGTGTAYSFVASPSTAGSYRAVFTNTQGSANSSAATLTVYSKPAVITSPSNQTVSVPAPVTFTAVGLADVIPAVTWQYQANGSTGFVNVSSGSASVSAGTTAYNTVNGTATLTFTPIRADSGDLFRAEFSDAAGSATTTPATLTVLGSVIADWTFPNVVAAPYDSPTPTVGNGTLISLGMQNDFNPGTESSGAYDDTTPTSGTVDGSYTENTWRVRGGSSYGGAGSPEGWSSFAPEFYQGVQMQVPTTGYSNIHIHFDWYGTANGPRNAVVQYTTDGYTWQTYVFPNQSATLVGPGDDYYGSTNSTTPPTGVTLDFAGNTAVSNNPSFAIRMVDEYQQDTNPAASDYLPDIYDGNTLIADNSGNVIAHGQYGTANGTGSTDTTQEIQIGGDSTTLSGYFTLSVPTSSGIQTTAPIAYSNQYSLVTVSSNTNLSTYTSTLANSIQSALAALPGLAGTSVTYDDGMAGNFIIQFPGTVTKPGVVSGAMTSNINPAGVPGLTGSADSAEAYAFSHDPDVASNESASPSVNLIYAGTLVPYSVAGTGNWRFGNIDFTGDTGAPSIFQEPASQTIELTSANPAQPVTFTASAYSATPDITVQWEVSTDGGITFNPVTNGSGGTTVTAIPGSSDEYTSSYTFTSTTTAQSGYEFKAVFTDTDNSQSSTTAPATLLVVQPAAPTVTTQPITDTVVSGATAIFTTVATGLPLDAADSTTTWQQSANGTNWTNLSSGSVVNSYATLSTGYISESSTLAFTASLSQNGDTYRAVLTNASGTTTTTAVVLTVLPVEPAVTQWNFGGTSPTGIEPAGYGVSAKPPYAGGVNTPAPNISTAPGTLTTIGFIDSNFTPPSVPAADITLSQGAADPSFGDNTWRIRGGPTPSTPGAQGVNGWDPAAPEYTQGAEIDVNAANLQDVYLSFQWFATTNAIRDLQVQYCLDTTSGAESWVNLGSPLIATPNDFYGESSVASGNAFVPNSPAGVVANLTNVGGVSGDAHLGIRLVSAYDPALGSQYASATLVNGVVQPYGKTSGNWRFGNIQVSGVAVVPAWLSPASSSANGGPAVWNYFTQTLTVNSGTATIISNPALSGDSPNLIVSGPGATLDINYSGGNTVNIGSLMVSSGSTVAMTSTSPNILIVPAGATFSIDSTSKLDLGTDYLDLLASNAPQGAAVIASVNGLVAGGYNHGQWNGHGIESSAAAADSAHLRAVGVIENNGVYGAGSGTLGSFDKVTPGVYDVLVRETYYGDANLDGKVDGSDYSHIDAGYSSKASLSGWANGDFNYDGVVDGTDYALIDNAFNSQGAALLPAAVVAQPRILVANSASLRPDSQKKVNKSTSSRLPAVPPAIFSDALIVNSFPTLSEQQLKKVRADTLAGSVLDGPAASSS
jgi:hypothetical protein